MSNERPAATDNVRALPNAQGYDRVPPHNLDAEISVLGSMLLSKDAIAEVSELLGPEDFYRGAHRTVFEAIRSLYDRGEPVDAVTLADELERRDLLEHVGGVVAITNLLAQVPTAANAVYYGRIVADHALRRRLISTGTSITKLGYEPATGAEEAVDEAEQLMYQVATRQRAEDFRPMKELVTEGFNLIERLYENKSAVTGLATGFADLDELTAGLQPSNLVIIAARPSMGKCLGGSTEVVSPVTGERTAIRDLVARGGADVIALDGSWRLVPRTTAAVHDNGIQPVWRLRTKLGREIVATANHPFRTLDAWVPLAELSAGTRIATPGRLAFFGADALPDEEVSLLGLLAGANLTTTTSASKPPSPVLLDAPRVAGERAEDAAVPAVVFRLPKPQVGLFLDRLFAGAARGHRDDDHGQIAYTTVSKQLARDLQHLLLRFGVIAETRRRRVDPDSGKFAWELRIAGALGKEEALRQAHWPRHQHARVGRRRPTRNPLEELTRELARAPEGQALLDLAGPDVYWDEVVAIEPAGEERVYDLTVPGEHNFVANDLVVHNSTLVTNMATHVAVEQRKPVVLFSLEMGQMELVQRILAAEAKVDSDRLRTGRLQEADWPKLSQAMGRLAEAPIFIDDTAGINLMEIRSKCRRLKQRHGLDLVIVDYLQLMQSHRRHDNRVQEVAEFSRGLKILAKELEVPVIALSQLSRRPEERSDRRPQLSDLRESGSIEQDADIVCFIYRDEVYDQDSAAKGEAELIVAKHRNGPLRTVRLSFIGHHSRFASMARGPVRGPDGNGRL